MELLELNNANQTTVNSTFNPMNGQQSHHAAQHMPVGQMYPNSARSYQSIHHNHPQQQHQTQQGGTMYTNNQEHRELPVDVPDSFVGVTKQSPRYPPPKPHRQVSPSVPMNNLTSFNRTPANMMYNQNKMGSQSQQQPVAPPIAQSHAANIVTHNSSLRSSIKLKQLEKSRGGQQHGNYPVGQMKPAVNQAFELNEDECVPSPPQITNQQINNNQSANIAATKQLQQNQAHNTKQTIPDLGNIYHRLQRVFDGDTADVVGDAKFVKSLSIYNTIVQTHNKQFTIPDFTSRHATTINSQGNREPVTYKVSELVRAVIYLLSDREVSAEAQDLLAILCKHEVDGVSLAFDRIAQSFEFAISSQVASSPISEMVSDENEANLRPPDYPHSQQFNGPMYQYQPQQLDSYGYASNPIQMDVESNLYHNGLPPLTDIDLNDGNCTRPVRIQKNSNQALGATIKNEEGRVVIGRIISGGAAHESGSLDEGDEIYQVNGIKMRGKTIDEVINIIEAMHGILEFTIISRNYKPVQRMHQDETLVKTFIEYDGANDPLIPCRELGLSFKRNEILTIIDQSDQKWWHARRENDSKSNLAGLIPSINFLKERAKDSNHEDFTNAALKRERKNLVLKLFNCPKGSSPRRRKKFANIPFGPDEIPYYEEVTPYYPTQIHKRPIILVGPKMIGQRDIVAKLLQDTSRFANAVSHTSRPMQPLERNGVDFHFVSDAQFAADIKAQKFIEYGKYQNHYYGTSLEAMKEVATTHRKICVHLVNLPSIFNFRQGRAGYELKPFFVFVKPDDSHPEKLRNIVASFSQPKSNIEENIKAIKAEVELIETHYLPYFDFVLEVSDVDRAVAKLLAQIDKIEREPQWIPMSWRNTGKASSN